MWILGGADFNKVAKRLFWDLPFVRLLSCGFALYLYSVFVGEQLWSTASEQIILYTIFNLFFLINCYTFEDIKVSVLL